MAAKLLIAASAKASLVDFGVIESRIEHFTQQDIPRNIAFAKLVLRDVYGVAESEIDDCIVDGGNDRGLDIVYVDHANKVINLGSCKCVTKYKKAQSNFPGDEVDKIISIVDDILYRNEEALSAANGALSAHIRQIWELLESDNFAIKVHLFSNQAKLVRDERDRLVSRLLAHRAELYEHSLYELSHGVVRALEAPVPEAAETKYRSDVPASRREELGSTCDGRPRRTEAIPFEHRGRIAYTTSVFSPTMCVTF